MPPKETKRSTQPNRTSRLQRIIGQVRNSTSTPGASDRSRLNKKIVFYFQKSLLSGFTYFLINFSILNTVFEQLNSHCIQSLIFVIFFLYVLKHSKSLTSHMGTLAVNVQLQSQLLCRGFTYIWVCKMVDYICTVVWPS